MMTSDPYWWEDAGAPAVPVGTALPPEVDVAIIGAGLTGLSAARTLARAGRSVLVLDKGGVGSGASSRNGGMIGGGHRLSTSALEARFGPSVAHGLLREAHVDSRAFCLDLMRGENIDCDYVQTGRFRGLWKASEFEHSARELEQLQKVIPLEAEMIPKTRQHEEVASDLYAGGTVYPLHGGLNPAKWVAGLADAAIRAGAQIAGDCAVLSVAPRADAGFDLRTTRGLVRAGAVLAATNGYTPAALPKQRRGIVPIPSFIAVTEPLGANRVRALIPKGRMIAESRERHCYYRPSPDGTRLIFGGRAAMFAAPQAFVRRELAALIRQIFPDLGAVQFSHCWTGRTGFSFGFLPSVGQIDGIWHAMGFSGSGNAMAPWLGHKAALQMLGDPEGTTAFSHTGLPTRPWHRGAAWFLPFADVTFRARDLWNNARRSK